MSKIVITMLCVLAIGAGALPSQPSTTASGQLRDYGSNIDPEEDSCLKAAFIEYNLVLTDPPSRADHYYLAQTYYVMAKHNLEC